MKRLIPVLALALILSTTMWSSALALDAPVKLRTVQYDHPWGGDHQNPGTPLPVPDPDPKDPPADQSPSYDFASWLTLWFYNSTYYLEFLPKGDGSVEVIEEDETSNDTSIIRGLGR